MQFNHDRIQLHSILGWRSVGQSRNDCTFNRLNLLPNMDKGRPPCAAWMLNTCWQNSHKTTDVVFVRSQALLCTCICGTLHSVSRCVGILRIRFVCYVRFRPPRFVVVVRSITRSHICRRRCCCWCCCRLSGQTTWADLENTRIRNANNERTVCRAKECKRRTNPASQCAANARAFKFGTRSLWNANDSNGMALDGGSFCCNIFCGTLPRRPYHNKQIIYATMYTSCNYKFVCVHYVVPGDDCDAIKAQPTRLVKTNICARSRRPWSRGERRQRRRCHNMIYVLRTEYTRIDACDHRAHTNRVHESHTAARTQTTMRIDATARRCCD